MANAVIGYKNWVNLPAAGLTASGGVTTLPVTNLIDPQVVKCWRVLSSSDSGLWPAAWFGVDFGAAVNIDLLAFAQPWSAEDPVAGTGLPTRGVHMLAASDTVRHELSLTALGNHEVYDSGTIASNIAAGYGMHAHFPGATKSARYWKCTMTATSYTTASPVQAFLDVGRAWAGPIVQASVNPVYGMTDLWQDNSRVTIADLSGAEYIQVTTSQRMLDFRFDFLTTAEGEATIKELDRVIGLRTQLFFALDPSGLYLPTQAMFCRQRSPNPIGYANLNVYDKTFSLRQSL